MTQVELAEKLSVTDKAVSRWESGAGLPEISMFPLLSNIFNVSIDYLITGKMDEPKISLDDMDVLKRAEYLIKKDDVDNFINYHYNKIEYLLYDDIQDGYVNIYKDFSIKDEIYKNQSVKIFSMMIDLLLSDKNNKSKMSQNALSPASLFKDNLDDFVKMCALSNRVDALEYVCFPIFAIGEKQEGTFYSMENFATTYLIKGKTLDFIYSDNRVSKEVIEYVSTMRFYSLNNKYDPKHIGINFFMNDIILLKLYEYKEYYLLEKALADLNNNLDYSLKECTNKSYDGYSTYRRITIKNGYTYCSKEISYNSTKVVAIVFPIIKAVEKAIKEKDIAWLEKFNCYNLKLCNECYKDTYHLQVPQYYLTDDELELVRLKSDPKSTDDDILIQKYTKNYITDIDGMLSDMDPEKNLSKIGSENHDVEKYKRWLSQVKHIEKNLVDKFYIHKLELFENLINKNDFVKMFKIAVDYKLDGLTDLVLKQDKKAIMDYAIKQFVSKEIKANSYLEYYKNKKSEKITCKKKEIEEIIELLTHKKKNKEVYDNCCLEINEKYINKLIFEGDLDTAVIKLCVRLEATLKYKYEMDGDLIEMIDDYLSTLKHKDVDRLYWEAEQNEDYVNQNLVDSYNEHNAKIDRIKNDLHLLRKVRNSIVHSSEKIPYSKENVLEWTKTVMEEI